MSSIVRRGSTGDGVLVVQRALIERGYLSVGWDDGKFGVITESAVKHFQSDAGLEIDGVVGPITMAVLVPRKWETPPPALSSWQAAFISAARAEVGVREVGNNGGRRVEEFLASVGLSRGNPWCMAFVYFVAKEASDDTGQAHRLAKTGHVLTAYNTARNKLMAYPAEEGKTGDVFIMDFGGGRGHTGIIVAAKNGLWDTIEGNTNEGGSREGDGVYVKKRKYSQAVGVIRLP